MVQGEEEVMGDEHEDPDHPIDDDTEETLPVQDL